MVSLKIPFLIYYFMFLFRIGGQVYVLHKMLHPKLSSRGQTYLNYHYRKRLNFRGPKTHENKPKPTKMENFRRQADENSRRK
jgi:hypothetical protein